MKYWVGVTDNRWFTFLAGRDPDEVNFWQPSATPPFKGAPMGLPFLFKLKRPGNRIAGGGFFVTYSTLPLSLAWEVFGEKNGAATLEDFRALVDPLVGGQGIREEIGCTVLSNPFFLRPEAWIEPAGWSGNIVRGKMYDSTEPSGAAIWDAVSPHVHASDQESIQQPDPAIGEPTPKYGSPFLVAPRLGQSSFRVLVTDAYKRRCAITGENTLVALEAAHIRRNSRRSQRPPATRGLSSFVRCGPRERHVRLSREDQSSHPRGVFQRKGVLPDDDARLSVVPDSDALRPDPDRLDWHYKNCFQA